MDNDMLMVLLRSDRNELLIKTDKYALPDWPHESLEKQKEWLDYRQALRDLPTVTEDPANVVWPTAVQVHRPHT